jgi:hypothetical protein
MCEATTTMQATVASDGRRLDFCQGCRLLWRVDRRLRRAVAHQVTAARLLT